MRQCEVQVAEPQCLFGSALQDRIEIFKPKQLLGLIRRDHRARVMLRQVHHANDFGTVTVTLRNEGRGTVEATEQECAREIVCLATADSRFRAVRACHSTSSSTGAPTFALWTSDRHRGVHCDGMVARIHGRNQLQFREIRMTIIGDAVGEAKHVASHGATIGKLDAIGVAGDLRFGLVRDQARHQRVEAEGVEDDRKPALLVGRELRPMIEGFA